MDGLMMMKVVKEEMAEEGDDGEGDEGRERDGGEGR